MDYDFNTDLDYTGYEKILCERHAPNLLLAQKFHQAILRWKPGIRHSTNIKQAESDKLCRGYQHCKITLPE